MLGDILEEREKEVIRLKKDNPSISSRNAAKIINKHYAKGDLGKVSHRYILSVWKREGLV